MVPREYHVNNTRTLESRGDDRTLHHQVQLLAVSLSPVAPTAYGKFRLALQ